ncbi:MAG: dipeptidyl aminopeptidase/acylaminoacyl peptidase [Candidatus Azotimanducaceae bacterium]
MRQLYQYCVLLLIILTGPAAFAAPSIQPVKFFSTLPISNYQLSPTGGKIAYFVPRDGRRVLVVHNLDGTDPKFVRPWEDELELVEFFWKAEDVVVFTVHMTLKRPQFRIKTTETRLIAYDFAENKIYWLGRPKRRSRDFASQQERVVDRLMNDPDHLLLELDFELDGYPSIYKTNVRTGKRKIYQKQRSGINDWFSDDQGKIRLGFGFKARGVKLNILYLDKDNKWQKFTRADLLNYEFVGLGPEPGQLYMMAGNEHGTRSMLLVDMESGQAIKTLFTHPEVDIGSMRYHPATGKVIGVEYTDDFRRYEYFDQDFSVVQRSLEKALPGKVVAVTDKSRDANLYVVLAYDDRDPGQYYIYDRDNRKLNHLASHRSDIDPTLSGETRRVNIPVTDGRQIPAYITLPDGDGEARPAVVLPHGGPSARDSADWDYLSQFLASRGYVVIKPNFRGSTGYGKSFEDKGHKQWGGLMQQDLTDTTLWLIEQGYAIAEKICIAGVSYGGYAAMMGLVQQPQLYKCGISINGVMDLPSLKSKDRNLVGGRDWTKRMGLEGHKDAKVSPQQQANQITAPVLLIASTNDARISYKQTKRLHRTLKGLKRDSTYVELDTGTHYMLNGESRHGMLVALEQFLEAHLQ